MKRLFILILSASIIFAGCRTTMPIREDDVSVNVKLYHTFMHPLSCERGCQLHHHGHYHHHDHVGFHVGFHGGFYSDDSDAFLVFLLLLFTAGWYFGSTRMYVAPEGFENEYLQQLYWGDNKVFLPKETEQDGTVLIMETFGNSRRKWRYPFTPEPNKGIILKDSVIREYKFKPKPLNKTKSLKEVKTSEEDMKDLGITQ